MISKKYVQELMSPEAFKRDYSKTIEDLYDYVIHSEHIGAHSQCVELVKRMSREQFSEFLSYLDNNVYMIKKSVKWRFD